MITNDRQLQQAVEQLGRMQHALAYFCTEVLPKSRAQFALMAERPLEEIRRLEEEIGTYIDREEREAPPGGASAA